MEQAFWDAVDRGNFYHVFSDKRDLFVLFTLFFTSSLHIELLFECQLNYRPFIDRNAGSKRSKWFEGRSYERTGKHSLSFKEHEVCLLLHGFIVNLS
jgi:hypothetical protein